MRRLGRVVRTKGRRVSGFLIGCAAVISIAMPLALFGEEHADALPVQQPQVICLTEWGDSPTGVYRSRPHACDLHERGKPAFHPSIAIAMRLRWLHWGGRVAVAKGKLAISTYGLAPLKVRLSGLREICGHTVYTKAQLFMIVRYDGKAHRSRWSMALDNCLR